MEDLPQELHKELLFTAIKSSENIAQRMHVITCFSLIGKRYNKVVTDNKSALIELLIKFPLTTIDDIPDHCMFLVKKLAATDVKTVSGMHYKDLAIDNLNGTLYGKLHELATADLNKKDWNIICVGNYEKIDGIRVLMSCCLRLILSKQKQAPLNCIELKKAYKNVIEALKKGWFINPLVNAPTENERRFSKKSIKGSQEAFLMQMLIERFGLKEKAHSFKDTASHIIFHLNVKKEAFDEFQSIFYLDKTTLNESFPYYYKGGGINPAT